MQSSVQIAGNFFHDHNNNFLGLNQIAKINYIWYIFVFPNSKISIMNRLLKLTVTGSFLFAFSLFIAAQDTLPALLQRIMQSGRILVLILFPTMAHG